jgi:hypothetical protein
MRNKNLFRELIFPLAILVIFLSGCGNPLQDKIDELKETQQSQLGLHFDGLFDGKVFSAKMGTISALVFYTTGGVSDIGIASAIPTGWTVAVPEINSTTTQYHIDITAPSSPNTDFRMLVVATDIKGTSVSYWLTVQGVTGLAKIEIVTLPAKLSYFLGESHDFNGLAVKNIYTDGTESSTSEFSIEYNSNTFTAGTKIVTVKSNEQSERATSFDITVERTLMDTGLPVVYIETEGEQNITSKDDYVKTNIKIVDPANPGNNLENTGYKDKIRGRGNATWGYPKKPYKVKLDKKADILGMGSDKDWVLLANYCDKSLMRTGIAFKVSELLQFPWTPDARFVELVINGEYMGNYQIVEGIKQDSNRVDIPKTGFIIERDGYYLQEPKWFVTDSGYGYSFKNPDAEDDLTDAQYDYIKDYLNEFEDVLNSDSFDDPVNGYQKYIDTDSFVRWFLLQQIIANMDTNPYLVKADNTESSKLSMGPVWDFEWSMGIGWYDGARPRPAGYWTTNDWYYSQLLSDTAFVNKLQTMWGLNKSQITNSILQYMDGTKTEIMESQKLNFRRWNILNSRVSVGGIPLGSFEAEVACDRQFFINHMAWLDTAINSL